MTLMGAFRRAVDAWTEAALRIFASEARTDARDPRIEGQLRALAAEIEASWGDVDVAIEVTGERTSRHSEDETLNALRRIRLRGEPGWARQIAAFRRANVAKIRSLAGEQLDEMREILSDAELGAWRVEDLRKTIKERFGVTRSKADLLARDQVLKLNAAITQTRQRQAGVTSYVWSSSTDERVREEHRELDGTVQRWDDPPVTNPAGDRNHPGEDYQCRCVAIPILPELPDE